MKFTKQAWYVLIAIFLSPLFLKAQDWPNLAKYKDANEKLGAPAANENRVVFLGNSITENWARMDSIYFAQHGYIDRGISGQTSPQMLIRFMPDVVALKPKVVVILSGTNDIAGNTGPSTLEMIEDNIAAMTAIANANHIKVILSSVLPVYDYPWHHGLQPAEKIVTLNKWIRSFAQEHNCIYLDYFSSLVDDRKGMKSEYSGDGVRPNLAGYKVMEPLADKAIAEALQKNTNMNMIQTPSFNHLTVYVVNLKTSTDFYKDVMQLPLISEPFNDNKHSWFKITEHGQLHVVAGAAAIVPHDINIHLSFSVPSLESFMKHLDQYNIKYGNWKGDSKSPQLRPDGVKQIYFQDPDGYWIEVNDSRF